MTPVAPLPMGLQARQTEVRRRRGRLSRVFKSAAFDEMPTDSPLVGLSFGDLTGLHIPEREVVLERNGGPLFRMGDIIQVSAARGIGKTWFVRSLALLMASGGSAMGFRAPARFRVLVIDGEMAARDIQERDALLAQHIDRDSTEMLLVTVAADWQEGPMPRLDSPEGQAAIEPFIEWADVVIVDNRACLFTAAGERDPLVWAEAQRWILDLRRRGKLVVLVHHLGKNAATGSRGISNAEDVLNFALELSRPDDYAPEQGARFLLTFTKSRGAHGAVVEDATLALTPGGWVVEQSRVTLSARERAILEEVGANQHKTRTSVFKAVGGKKSAFYEAFEKLEETKALVHDRGVWTTQFPKEGTKAEIVVPGTTGEPTPRKGLGVFKR